MKVLEELAMLYIVIGHGLLGYESLSEYRLFISIGIPVSAACFGLVAFYFMPGKYEAVSMSVRLKKIALSLAVVLVSAVSAPVLGALLTALVFKVCALMSSSLVFIYGGITRLLS